jgi:hypothetical protein
MISSIRRISFALAIIGVISFILSAANTDLSSCGGLFQCAAGAAIWNTDLNAPMAGSTPQISAPLPAPTLVGSLSQQFLVMSWYGTLLVLLVIAVLELLESYLLKRLHLGKSSKRRYS